MSDLPKGFRVQVTERRSGRVYDLLVSGLSYELGLPGGFKTCEFTASAKDSASVYYLDDIKVFYGDDVAWEGQVEEIDSAGFATQFTCLGYAVTLKDQPLGVLFIDREFTRWRDIREVVQKWYANSYGQNSIFEAPVLDATDGYVGQVKIPAGTNWISNDPLKEEYLTVFYTPPWSARVRKVKMRVRSRNLPAGDHNAASSGSSGWNVVGMTADTINAPGTSSTGVDTGVSFAAYPIVTDGAVDVTMTPSVPLYWVYMQIGAGFISATTVTITVDQYMRWWNQIILGEQHPDTGATLLETEMTVDMMIRSILAYRIQQPIISPSDEAIASSLYVVQQATFDEATPETIIQRLCDLIGWEWGVFNDKRLYAGPRETVTALGFRSSQTADYPPWYLSLRVQDGHGIDVKLSNADVINQVQMKTTAKTGVRYETVYSNFNDARCPLNRPGSTPLEIRSRVVDVPQWFGQDDIATYAAALLARYGAPQYTGQVVISLPAVQRVDMGTTTPFLIGVSEIGGPDTIGGRPMEYQTLVDSPLIRPGYWCHFPDLETTLEDPVPNADSTMTRRPPGGLGMVRYVRVEAGDGGANVTLTLDDGSSRFDTALAQFLEGRV